jgi:signal transduction histidine kinase
VDILTDLLTYEKLEAGLMKLERNLFSVVDLVKKAISPFRNQARNKQIDMDIEGARPHCERGHRQDESGVAQPVLQRHQIHTQARIRPDQLRVPRV